MLKRLLNKTSLFHLILIAVIAALGIAVKPVVVPLAQLVTGPFVPGGAAAGGIYMLFVVLAASLTHVRGAGTLCGLCQGLLILALGVPGTHGAASLITYTLPGIAVDLAFLLLARKKVAMPACFVGGIAANVAGTVAVNFALFHMPLIPLLLSLCLAAFSGGLGGLGAWGITRQLKKWGIIHEKERT